MIENTEHILKRIDDVLKEYNLGIIRLGINAKTNYDGKSLFNLDFPSQYYQLGSRMLTTILDLTTEGNTYRELAKGISTEHLNYRSVLSLQGILISLRHDYEKGYLSSLSWMINAETFSGILDQASFLLSQNVRASAVVAGVALESHIRKLAEKHGIDLETEKGNYVKVERLNQDLKSKNAYSLNTQKSVTAWLDTRNIAAHADNEKIDKRSAELMIEGIRNFIEKYPA